MFAKTAKQFSLFLTSATLFCMPVHANVTIFPVQLNIGGEKGQRSTATNLVASSDAKAQSYEVSVFRWSQDASGQDILTPDTELMVNPLSFVLEPGTKRMIRMGFRQPVADMQLKQEAAWRVVFTPLPDAEKSQGIKFNYGFNIPLFAGKGFQADMSFVLVKNANNQPVILAKNAGTAHFQMSEFTLQNTTGKTLYNSSELKYVLPHQQVQLNLKNFTVAAGTPLKLVTKTPDSKTLSFDVVEQQ